MRKRFLFCFLISLFFVAAPRAFGHGEAGDKPFLKTLTSAFYDVTISPAEISVGEPVTITGKVRVLETWPDTLGWTGRAFLTAVIPGPVFALKDRSINGEQIPESIFVQKGGTYEFKLVIIGREPGRYHVHPGMAFEGVGTLLGPGTWVTVKPTAAGFNFPVTLLNGQTINLDTYHTSFIWWWNLAGFFLGAIWMYHWTFHHRTVTNLAVTLQLPVNDDAPDIGLITPRDWKWMNTLAALALVMLVGGWIYIARTYPVRLPQQTVWLTPEPLSSGDSLAEAKAVSASYNEGTMTLVMKVQIHNVSISPITLRSYITGMATFVNGGQKDVLDAGPRDFVGYMDVQPNLPIMAGETKELTLKITSNIFDAERIVPVRDPQELTAGLLRFEKAGGGQQMVVLETDVVPTSYQAQYLP
jgi:methane/ammonia monooxygenase subunit B